MRVVDLDQRSEEWLKWRMGVLTASRSAAIMGESPHQTAYDVFLEMTGRKAGFKGNLATDRGEQVENPAKAAYEIHNGFIETVPVCVLHPTVDFIGASLDAIELDTYILAELKYPSEKSHESALLEIVPRHYWIQVQHQLMCVPEAPFGRYWSHRDDNPKQIQIDHDKQYQANLFEGLCAFNELLKADIPPPLTVDDAKFVEDAAVAEICNRLVLLKDQSGTKAKQESDELKALVIRMGAHNRVRCGNVLISVSQTKAGKDSYRMTVAKAE